ncbi:hypothetical protein [Janthinobacterium fluminis]|uniref:DUF1453 domain-containing protein n=1 Tax=Janthinobacterium fluminis TaxID=2987524 RepID=A0ABT5K6U1_9BURK|nr:hypothetical protein [Janthinobacterium fluminis]MDC8760726.1 hypothetical protein [Janthinobacterium fluminis]
METTTLALLVLIPLLVWRIYARLKRMMGRQASQLWRHWAAAILLPLLLAALAVATKGEPLALSSLGAGALAGAWLGVWGVKLTRLENTDKGYFYTPNLRLGMLVAMQFAARVLYCGMELYMNTRVAVPVAQPDFVQSPLTLLSFGLLAGYYAAYAFGLLRWRRSQKPLAALQ